MKKPGKSKRDNDARLVLVEWVDSRSPASHWEPLRDAAEGEVCECVSVGFLVKDSDEIKILVPNMADVEDETSLQASGAITIPSCAVRRIVDLEEVDGSQVDP